MEKRILTAAAGVLMTLSAMAVPAKPGLRTFTQSDGTTITVELKGDERFHTYVTTDGLTVGRLNGTGDFKYMTPDGLSAVRAHNPGNRTTEEAQFLAKNAQELSIEKVAAKQLADPNRRFAVKAGIKAVDAMRKTTPQVPNNGEVRIPVVLISYRDVDFRDGADAKATFEDFFNGEGVSARQYFIDQSNGKYIPQFDIYGPYKLSGTRAVYGGNDRYNNDKGAGKMMAETCTGLNKEINFKDYDNDGDGVCDVVIGLYAGVGEASYDEPDAVWPHQWQLSASEYGRSLYFDGVTIDKYAVFNELSGTNTQNIDGIGTVCHEFSHCLGLPDFYETTYTYGYYGMGSWSLMCSGSYNNDGYTPIGYSAYEKDFMGWIKIEEGTPNTRYTLPAMNQKSADTDIAIKATSDRDPDEYFIFENRQRQGWDKYMAADGMLITHVTFNQAAWDNNCVNDYYPQRMCPVPADNKATNSSESGDLWPGLADTATSFTDISRPAASLNGGGMLSKPVTEITRNPDATISFMYMKGVARPLPTPTLEEPQNVSATGFTATWSHEDAPEEVSYTLEVTPHLDVQEIALTTFGEELPEGWTLENEEYFAGYDATYSCFKIGSSKRKGGIVSPAYRIDADNVITVTVEAQSYGSDNSSMVVSTMDDAGVKIDSKTMALDTQFKTYIFVLEGKAMENNRIVISTLDKKNRILIRTANIYSGDASSMFDGTVARAMENKDESGRLTITGITGNSYEVTGLDSEERYDYRIKAVSGNTDEYEDSEWSARRTVDLTSGIVSVEATADPNAPTEYFTLQGIKVDASELTPGIYVMRRGNTVTKTVIR